MPDNSQHPNDPIRDRLFLALFYTVGYRQNAYRSTGSLYTLHYTLRLIIILGHALAHFMNKFVVKLCSEFCDIVTLLEI